MADRYILKGITPVKIDDLIEWSNEYARQYESGETIIEQTRFTEDVMVSTIFLGLDYSSGDGPPLLFETMIFGSDEDGHQERYSTYMEAKAGHKKAVELVSKNHNIILKVKNKQT